MIANDIAGDPDGLFSTVHALLSPTAEVRGFVAIAAEGEQQTPSRSIDVAREILRIMNMTGQVPLHEGTTAKLTDVSKPPRSAGAQAIIDEAMRTDTDLPLFVTVGGGMTDMAVALILEPRIADRLTLVWIGGAPHDGPPTWEFNYSVDPAAVCFVFNDSRVPIWQVPSDAYGMCVISRAELELNVAPYGRIGSWLYSKTLEVADSLPFNTGETWTLGDSPLVVLTALTSWFASSPKPLKFENTGASKFVEIVTPRIGKDGAYEPRTEGRKMRVYTSIDTRTMHADLFAKLQLRASRHG
ncbi:MAG: nucleoside hydrolase [Rhizorhabdus sp.]